jgi:hypothetical protein
MDMVVVAVGVGVGVGVEVAVKKRLVCHLHEVIIVV